MTDLQAKYQKLATEYSKVCFSRCGSFIRFGGRWPALLRHCIIISLWLGAEPLCTFSVQSHSHF